MKDIKICVVGLGYVGLPLACLFSKKFAVWGFDKSEEKISELKSGYDRTDEIGEKVKDYPINFSSDPAVIKNCNFIVVAVPTPIDKAKNPDLSLVESASAIVGKNLSQGSTVVYESTVFPGCTEEICAPILEKESGLKFNADFFLGYSPERVNPGDKEHTIDKIVKIVSGSNPETLALVKEVYGSIINAVYEAPNIKTAEAAKVIENIQRDLNIALMNELSLIFERMNLDTQEVIEAAATKWNFIKFQPGLVGGHCISVDPYYLTHKSLALGYHPQVILAGRKINDDMPLHVAQTIAASLQAAGKDLPDCKVLILGLTFKENVPDLRNSKAKEVMAGLKSYGIAVFGHEPLVKDRFVEDYFNLPNFKLEAVPKVDAVIIFSPHRQFKDLTLEKLKSLMTDRPVLFDLKRFYDKNEAERAGFVYKHL